MSVHELFEIVEELCKENGIDKVEGTINYMFEVLREWYGDNIDASVH